MLKTQLLHPEILSALGSAGHGAQILIADGNYPVSTQAPVEAELVFLNLSPGLVSATDALKAVVSAVPIESAQVMIPDAGPEPSIFAEFRRLLPAGLNLQPLGRFDFYSAASERRVCLAIATGEQRVYANILLTIGVVPPP
ncbi:MAG TPA: RbsD/FucU family protein [Chthonomonadales bacterium]|nr:RbsD/FucU family protein [Chthonomonadales bacterium]